MTDIERSNCDWLLRITNMSIEASNVLISELRNNGSVVNAIGLPTLTELDAHRYIPNLFRQYG